MTSIIDIIKIPKFDKNNYGPWKKKMLLYIRVSNPRYMEILETGPASIMQTLTGSNNSEGDNNTSGEIVLKNSKDYTEQENDMAALDATLQLILIDSLDDAMYYQVVNCTTAKQIWETLSVYCEEIRENQLDILVSQFENFMVLPREGITEMYERYNKIINDLRLKGRNYSNKEINKRFLMNLPDHLEHKVSAIRKARDIAVISLDKIYGILKTYELEEIQKKSPWKPKQHQSRESYDELKQKYEALKQKYEALQRKVKGKTYIAEEKSWDASYEEENLQGNLALIAKADDSSSPLLSLLRLKEPAVLLRCREEDIGVVENVLDSAVEEYASKANVHEPDIIIDRVHLLPPPSSHYSHGPSCSGGVVMASRDG